MDFTKNMVFCDKPTRQNQAQEIGRQSHTGITGADTPQRENEMKKQEAISRYKEVLLHLQRVSRSGTGIRPEMSSAALAAIEDLIETLPDDEMVADAGTKTPLWVVCLLLQNPETGLVTHTTSWSSCVSQEEAVGQAVDFVFREKPGFFIAHKNVVRVEGDIKSVTFCGDGVLEDEKE
jgi:hypothetical protein